MTDTCTIALVDDEKNVLTSVSIALEAEGFAVQTFQDGASALEALSQQPVDLGIFDIKMPRMDGMELLRRLRLHHQMPVIFLTSKDEEIDELFGLKLGADDYIRKPFSARLVVERVRAVLRRSRLASDGENDPARLLQRGRLYLDPDRQTASWGGEPVTLTVTEFLILEALVKRPGEVMSRDALMDAAYDDQVYVDDRTIDSHIKRLRRKFKRAEDDFDAIETLYGVGYRWKAGWDDDRVIERGLLSLNLDRVTAKLAGVPVDLTAVEFGILRELALHPETPRSRTELLHDAYRYDRARVDDRAIDKAMARLRKKLRAVLATYDPIMAVPGVGYRFVTDRHAPATPADSCDDDPD